MASHCMFLASRLSRMAHGKEFDTTWLGYIFSGLSQHNKYTLFYPQHPCQTLYIYSL